MSHKSKLLVAALFTLGLTACVSPRSFVDPQYAKASYGSIQAVREPVPVKLDAQFQRNGAPYPAVNRELAGHVERTLKTTGVFAITADAPARISVTGNNIADIEAARSMGFKTGLTLGASGSMVDDNYEFQCTYQPAGGEAKVLKYQHAIHTAIGSTKTPLGLTHTTPANAFGRVVEEVMLNFVKDLQDSGAIPKQ